MTLEIKLAGKLGSINTVPMGQSGAPAPNVAQPARQAAAGGTAGSGQAQEPSDSERQQLHDELAQLQSAKQALIAAAGQLNEFRQQFAADAETQLLELSLEIAKKVVMQEIKAGSYEIEPIVKEALSRLPNVNGAAVHLHPDDLARCEMANSPEDSASLGVQFVADPSIGRAECIVKTAGGTVESHIDTHFEEIERTLKHQE